MDERTVPTRLGAVHLRVAGSGPPVVLWHSLYVDGRSMLPVAEALAADHQVFVPDGWCHGRTPRVGRTWTIDDCADATIDLLDALGLAAVDWVGNAWGGHIGYALARKAPDRVRSLVAICAPMQPVTGRDRFRARLLVGLYRLVGPIDRLTGIVAGVLVLPENGAAMKEVRATFAGQDRAALAEAMWCAMIGRGSAEGPIPVPTLLVTTERNALSSPDLVRSQAAAAGARVEVLTRSKHLSPLEEPEAVSALLRAWLPAPG